MRVCLFLLLICSSAWAEPLAIPVVGQPSPFYGAVGKNVTISAEVVPTEFPKDGICTYSLQIKQLMNASSVRRPSLDEIKEFKQDFQIDTLPDGPTTKPDERIFRYRLRPRRADISRIPEFTFPYYDPNIPQPPDRPGLPFRKVRTEELAIKLTQLVEPKIPSPVPLEIPHSFEKIALDHESWLKPSQVMTLSLGLLLTSTAVSLVLRIYFPNEANRRRRARSRLGRQTLRALSKPDLSIDDLHQILTHDVSLRWGDSVPIPADAASLFQKIDECRFSGTTSYSVHQLVDEARQLVSQWEARP